MHNIICMISVCIFYGPYDLGDLYMQEIFTDESIGFEQYRKRVSDDYSITKIYSELSIAAYIILPIAMPNQQRLPLGTAALLGLGQHGVSAPARPPGAGSARGLGTSPRPETDRSINRCRHCVPHGHQPQNSPNSCRHDICDARQS